MRTVLFSLRFHCLKASGFFLAVLFTDLFSHEILLRNFHSLDRSVGVRGGRGRTTTRDVWVHDNTTR